MLHSRSRKYLIRLFVVLALLSLTIFVLDDRQAQKGDALWQIVHARCVPNMQKSHLPAPCVSVDLSRGEAEGFVVFKDAEGNNQYLVMPTAKITGIEDASVLKPTATNYFSEAWEKTTLVNQGLPRTDFAVAVNSISGRSQDQLHLHVDCIQPSVKSALQQLAPQIATDWQKLPIKLAGEEYRAMWISGTRLDSQNPFRLLAESLPHPAQEMAGHTLVLAGAERSEQAGFILLDGKAPELTVAIASWLRLGYGSGEKLEDHACALATSTDKE